MHTMLEPSMQVVYTWAIHAAYTPKSQAWTLSVSETETCMVLRLLNVLISELHCALCCCT